MSEKDPKKVKAAKARANALTADDRSRIAAEAAQKRWALAKPIGVSNVGNFKEHFGVDVDCYVLKDATKTAVISQRGMGQAIGLSQRGDRLTSFVNSQTMADYIGRELRHRLENPIVFQRSGSAAKNAISAKANGYEASLLIDLCNAIMDAHKAGKLQGPRYAKMVQQAQIINGASAKNGIRQLVYALAGYSPSTDEVIEAFKAYVLEEARKYEPEFPNELYMQWHRLYAIPVPVRGKPWHFKHLTVRHIYTPLAQSSGKILNLLRALKSKDGDRQKKLFQFLNEVGARAIRMHLGRVLEMAESSKNKEEYEVKISDRFGDKPELDLIIPVKTTPSNQPPNDS